MMRLFSGVSTNFNNIISFLFIDNIDQFTIFLSISKHLYNKYDTTKETKNITSGSYFDGNKP